MEGHALDAEIGNEILTPRKLGVTLRSVVAERVSRPVVTIVLKARRVRSRRRDHERDSERLQTRRQTPRDD